MSTRPGGYGQEAYGDPLGGGGPLHVVRARALKGQVVRVVYDEEPVHKSAAGFEDALNPENYVFSIVSGQAVTPQAVGVDLLMVQGPAAGPVLAGDERAFDVHTDRELVVGVRYRVTVVSVRSKFGGMLGFPVAADFSGIVPLPRTLPPPRLLDLVDFASDPFGQEGFKIDTGGDVAIQGGFEGLRKRIFRRLVTPKNAFAFLPGYGVGLRLNQPQSVRVLQSLQIDIKQQVEEEPEVQAATVALRQDPQGILFITLRAKTKQGAFVDTNVSSSPNGEIVVS